MNRPMKQLSLSPRVTFWGVLLLAAAILFIRKGDSLTNPQFWAEDGVVFFAGQYHDGAFAILHPHAGYMLVAPRIVATLADWFFPYSLAPAVYNYASLFLTLLVVADVLSKRLSLNYRPLLALAVVLAPHYLNEIFLNVTNIQWILSLLLVTTLLKEPPDEKYGNVHLQKLWDIGVVAICGLTGLFVIAVTPFFAWRWRMTRSTHAATLFGLALSAALIQLSCITLSSEVPEARSTNIWVCLGVIGFRLWADLFLGLWLEDALGRHISLLTLIWVCFGLFICFVVLLITEARRQKKMSRLAVLLGVLSAVVVMVFIKSGSNIGALFYMDVGMRYFYIPAVMLIWSVVMCMDSSKAWRSVVFKVLLCAALMSSLTSGFRSGPWTDQNWKDYSKQIGKDPNLVIPINPGGWRIELKR